MNPSTNTSLLNLKLSLQLREFGLNPEHWEIQALSDTKAAARHKNSEIFLLGAIHPKEGFWTQIELYEKEEIFG